MEALIMTGGKGLRMAPFTKVLPKGLLPVGERPILELIVKQLTSYGFREITMACGYLAPLIQTYFGDGHQYGARIHYVVESEPLGTVGALRSLPIRSDPLLVLNCDVLTTLHFRDVYEAHCAGDAMLTVASQIRHLPVHLGVLDVEGERVVAMREKPPYTLCVSMGIYVMNPEVIRYIPEHGPFDTPELIQKLLGNDEVVHHYLNDAYWLDVGRPEDYETAQQIYPVLRDQLLSAGPS